MADGRLFEDIFDVRQKDPDGRKFDRVSRLICSSENYEMELILDIHIDLYPVDVHDRFTFVLARTLSLTNAPDTGLYDQSKQPSLADKFEYVMHGKVYRCEEDSGPSQRLAVYVSFGGLLMRLRGDARNLQGIDMDSYIYLLMRKV
eukprot:m.9265 g.9265  ORF g.9265 m.9265 type:complete len:146 (+) comp4653_c0_seq1:227-664(+)